MKQQVMSKELSTVNDLLGLWEVFFGRRGIIERSENQAYTV